MSPQPVCDKTNQDEDKRENAETRTAQAEIVIETTVGEVSDELWRCGLDRHDRIRVTVLSDELIPGRREARARVIAAGLTDDDIDQLIEEARTEAQSLLNK